MAILLVFLCLVCPVWADETAKAVVDLRQYITKRSGVQLVHLGIFHKEGMSNIYALRDDRGLFLAHADHLINLADGWRVGPSLVWKRGGNVQASLVADWNGKAGGGNAYCWIQLRTPWPKGTVQVVLDPLQLTWPIGKDVSAGVRSTIVLTDGQKPFVGVGPTVNVNLGASTSLDVHYYPGPNELRIQLVQKI